MSGMRRWRATLTAAALVCFSTSCTMLTGASGSAEASLVAAGAANGGLTTSDSAAVAAVARTPHRAVTGSTEPDPEVLVLAVVVPARLYPGSSVPLDLTVSNTGRTPRTLDEATVTAAITTPRSTCRPDNFALVMGHGGDVSIPGAATVSLSSRGVPRRLWPVLEMRDTRRNQDACAGVTVTLRLTGRRAR